MPHPRLGSPRALLLLLLLQAVMPNLAAAQDNDDPSQPYLRPPPLSVGVEAEAAPAAEPEQRIPEYQDYGSPAGANDAPPSYQVPPAPPPPRQTEGSPPPRPLPTATEAQAPPPRPVPEEEPAGSVDLGLPDFAIGLDPIDFIVEGRFGLLLEVKLWKFISFEFQPVFFIDDSPLLLDLYAFKGRREGIYRASDGLGPLVGAEFGLGLWLSRTPFSGWFLRPFFRNLAVEYESKVDGVVVDRASFVERRLGVLFGTMKRFGPVGLTLGLGLSYELNGTQRCDLDLNGPLATPRSERCGQRYLLWTGDEPADTFGPLHPLALEGRIAISIVAD